MNNQQGESFDLLVIGGGVNGTGIAADAAGRGLKVLLCEQNDFASATSSNSSKLIHGGLRYLEHYEFRLVKEALAEREVLLANAPHIMKPLRFILPHRPHLRPAWMIRAGLFLYDNLAKRKTLSGSCGVKFDRKSPLLSSITKGFEYSDGWVDDARLVVLNALQAKKQGAELINYCKCTKAQRIDGVWHAKLESNVGSRTVKAKAIVNATGPWVTKLFDEALSVKAPQQVRLVKGSHIIVPHIHELPQAYILQNDDGRIVFVLPYENDYSIVGTTDVEYFGDPKAVAIDDEEIDYLIRISNEHFKHKIGRDDIVHTYSGVRPLLEDESSDPQAVTRDYLLELDQDSDQAPLLSVFGGKITTYRKLAEAAVNKLEPFFPRMSEAWTAKTALPGGDFSDKAELLENLQQRYSYLSKELLGRYIRCYGTLSLDILAEVSSVEDMGRDFGFGLYQREVEYLCHQEWACCSDDIIWRRTKLGLKLTAQQISELQLHIQTYLGFNANELQSNGR